MAKKKSEELQNSYVPKEEWPDNPAYGVDTIVVDGETRYFPALYTHSGKLFRRADSRPGYGEAFVAAKQMADRFFEHSPSGRLIGMARVAAQAEG